MGFYFEQPTLPLAPKGESLRADPIREFGESDVNSWYINDVYNGMCQHSKFQHE